MLDLAEALGMDMETLNKRQIGQAFNAEQVVAARKLLIQSATAVGGLMKRAAEGNDADVMAYAEAKARHQMIQAQVAGITAEAGRALRAFRSIAGQEMAMGVDQFIRESTGKTLFQLKEEAKLGSLLDTPEKVSKYMADVKKPGAGHMLAEYWINGLVSGPKTHVTNLIGNAILAITKAVPDTATAAIIGSIKRSMGRKGETVKMGEVGVQLSAARRGLPSAIKAAAQALRTGRSTLLPGEEARTEVYETVQQDLAPAASMQEDATYAEATGEVFGMLQGMLDGITATGKLVMAGGVKGAPLVGLKHSPLGAIPDITFRGANVLPVGTAIRIPTRMLAAGDSFFRAVNYSMEKNALAYRSAMEQGLQGSAFDSRVAELRQSPTPEMMETARISATDLALMARKSAFVNALGRLANTPLLGLPIMKFVVPFINTPANIIEQTVLRRTPIGLLSPELRADLLGKNGTVAQDTAQARMLLGSAVAVGFGFLAAKGLVTGSGPSDREENALWRLGGNQAHSVRIGDMWYQINQLGPMGMLASISADLYDVAHAAQEGDMEKAGSSLLSAFTQNILDASWMTGPSDLIQATQDPARYGERYIQNFLSSMVPFSGAMGQTARFLDPYSREANDTVASIKAKVPLMSMELLPRLDIWGEPIENRTSVGSVLVTGIYTQEITNDPVNRAMMEGGYWPGMPGKTIRGVELTDEQYNLYAQLAGRMSKQQLTRIVTSGAWQQWPPQVKRDVITETIRQSRETARGMVMARNPQIIADAVKLKLAPLQ